MLKLENLNLCFENRPPHEEMCQMKKVYVLLVAVLLTKALLLPNVFAQHYTQWQLPDGAKARFGKGWINDIKFSPNGSQLAVATTIGVWLYDVRTGEETALFTGLMRGANAISYSPGGLILAAAHWDQTIRLWDVSRDSTENGTPLSTFRGHTGKIYAIAFSPDGGMLASGSADKTVRIWDIQTEKLLSILPGHKDAVYTAEFSPDSKLLASGTGDGTIQVWDTGTGERIYAFNGHTDAVWEMDFTSNSTVLASASLDGTVQLWTLISPGGKLGSPAQPHTAVYSVDFSPDGHTFATGRADKVIQVWNTSTTELVSTLSGHSDAVRSVEFSPIDSRTLASGSLDGTLRLWDMLLFRQRVSLAGHTGGVKTLVYTEDNRIRACGTGLDSKLRLWDAGTSSALSILREHTGLNTAVAFSKDGKTVASGGSENGTIFLSDVTQVLSNNQGWENSGLLSTLTGNRHGITALAFSPADTTLASGGTDGKIYLLDVETGRELKVLKGAQSIVTALTFVHDGTHLFSGEANGTVRKWDTLSGKEEWSSKGAFSAITALAFSPYGHFLAIGDEIGKIWLFDNQKKEIERSIFTQHTGEITALVFSGNTLVSGSEDGTILLWDISTIPSPPTPPKTETVLTHHSAPQQTAQQVARNALNSTVYLAMQKADGRISQGSGFFVHPGYVATNHHVTEGATGAYVKLVGQDTIYTVESIAATDEEHDLALLKVTGISTPVLPLANSDAVQIGETVYAIGNPQGFLEGTVSDGIISSIRGESNKKWLQMTAPISPGSSGGPVLNTRGEVIGVSVGDINGQNLNFAVPSNYLKALLQQVQ